jgi:hypothetical protein
LRVPTSAEAGFSGRPLRTERPLIEAADAPPRRAHARRVCAALASTRSPSRRSLCWWPGLASNPLTHFFPQARVPSCVSVVVRRPRRRRFCRLLLGFLCDRARRACAAAPGVLFAFARGRASTEGRARWSAAARDSNCNLRERGPSALTEGRGRDVGSGARAPNAKGRTATRADQWGRSGAL